MGAIEIKLSEKFAADGIKNLLKLSSKVNTQTSKKTSFLMVLTADNASYISKDGVYIISIATLKLSLKILIILPLKNNLWYSDSPL